MARSRMIKPETYSDEKLASVSIQARYLFISLWVLSDDYGVVKGHHRWIQSQAFPYGDVTPSDFDTWMEEIIKLGFIVSFDSSGEKFYHIKNFSVHQKVDRPSRQRNPPPPSNTPMHSESLASDEKEISTESMQYSESLASHSRVLVDETERETERETEEKEVHSSNASPTFNELVSDLVILGIESKAEAAHQATKKNNLNRPASLAELTTYLASIAPAEWPPDLVSLRAEQWYNSHIAAVGETGVWKTNNKPIKDWHAKLKNKITFWLIEDKNKNNGKHFENKSNNGRSSGLTSEIKRDKFDSQPGRTYG